MFCHKALAETGGLSFTWHPHIGTLLVPGRCSVFATVLLIIHIWVPATIFVGWLIELRVRTVRYFDFALFRSCVCAILPWRWVSALRCILLPVEYEITVTISDYRHCCQRWRAAVTVRCGTVAGHVHVHVHVHVAVRLSVVPILTLAAHYLRFGPEANAHTSGPRVVPTEHRQCHQP